MIYSLCIDIKMYVGVGVIMKYMTTEEYNVHEMGKAPVRTGP